MATVPAEVVWLQRLARMLCTQDASRWFVFRRWDRTGGKGSDQQSCGLGCAPEGQMGDLRAAQTIEGIEAVA